MPRNRGASSSAVSAVSAAAKQSEFENINLAIYGLLIPLRHPKIDNALFLFNVLVKYFKSNK